jgi:hypothetical protein
LLERKEFNVRFEGPHLTSVARIFAQHESEFCRGRKPDNKRRIYVGFEILTAMVMKSIIFWVITPYSPLKVNRRFGETSTPFSGPKKKPGKKPKRRLTLN